MKRPRKAWRREAEVLCPTLHAVLRLQRLQNALDAFLDGVVDPVVAKTAKVPARWVGLSAAPALRQAVRDFMHRRRCTLREFLLLVLLPALRTALQFPQLFAATSAQDTEASTATPNSSCSVAVNQPAAVLTRRQVWCVLANMFFCAFPPRTEGGGDASDSDRGEDELNWVDAGLLPTTDYAEMVTAPAEDNSVEVAKLLLLLDFFAEAQHWSAEEGARVELKAYRAQVPRPIAQGLVPRQWCAAAATARGVLALLPLLAAPLPPVVLHALGESIDDQPDMIRLDFANRWIGGGALASGAVQEEITFAQCPALNVLRWFHSRMGHAESIVATDYRQYGRVAAGTYGSGLRYGEPLQPPQKLGGALLAVDALDFRFDTVDEQSQAAVYRELMKLVSGFCSPAVAAIDAVAGGNWGCGVFGGDYELKFLLQWVACGMTGKVLHYFPFDNSAFARFVPLASLRCTAACVPALTAENALTFLYSLEDASDGDVEAVVDTEGEGEFGPVWSAFLKHFSIDGACEEGVEKEVVAAEVTSEEVASVTLVEEV